MNKVYRGGVARSASLKNKGGKTHYRPYVSQALYDANKKWIGIMILSHVKDKFCIQNLSVRSVIQCPIS